MSELSKMLARLGVASALETYLGPILGTLRVSGIGIIPSTMPDRLRLKCSRKYGKKGKVIFYDDVPVKELRELRDYTFFLINRVNGESVGAYANIGVIYFELARASKKLKLRFKPWEIYRGKVCVGKVCADIRWMMHVPTYRSNSILILCHPEDFKRREVEGNTVRVWYPAKRLLEAYITGKRRTTKIISIYETLVTPLFL